VGATVAKVEDVRPYRREKQSTHGEGVRSVVDGGDRKLGMIDFMNASGLMVKLRLTSAKRVLPKAAR
jgi:hypothetical protein